MDFTRREFLATSTTLIASTQMSFAQDVPLAPPDRQPPDLKVPDPVPRKIGWAIVGLGQLALEEVMPAFSQCRLSRPVALVSGHPEKARQVAQVYGIPEKSLYNYDNYDQLADNPDVDVIYIILPNSMHAEFTIRGFQAGKHVLCEKPMATSVAECEAMIAAGRKARRKLMIAYRLRYEPFNIKAIELCRAGELGTLKTMSATHSQNVKPPNIRLSRALGGGPVGDVGIYCLNAFRYLSGAEPVAVSAVACQPANDPRFREVPESVSFQLDFPSGLLAIGNCSFGTSVSRNFQIEGSEGFLRMEGAFGYEGQRLFVQKEQQNCEHRLIPVNHFAAEMDHFSECLLHDHAPRTPGEEGLADQRILAAIDQAVQTERRVKIET